jgi:hypothetical protein
MVLLSTQTASNAASVSFTSGIDNTYRLYIFKFYDVNPATNGTNFTFQANVAGQSGFNETVTSTYFHAEHDESGVTANLSYANEHDQAQGTAYQILQPVVGSGSDESGAGELFLFNPSNTTYVKHWYYQGMYYHGSNYAINGFVAGYFNVTGAIDEIDFKMASGNMDGVIKMYGIG